MVIKFGILVNITPHVIKHSLRLMITNLIRSKLMKITYIFCAGIKRQIHFMIKL